MLACIKSLGTLLAVAVSIFWVITVWLGKLALCFLPLRFLRQTLFFSYAPWCPACQNLQPEWEKFAEWGEDLEVNIAKVDVTEQPGNPCYRYEKRNNILYRCLHFV